ncbi:MAG TPA: PAS domain S-box protein [Geminicoccaceae bacterium]|nr:PAS domain S-box protein [Geminicoccaceae bacterium]
MLAAIVASSDEAIVSKTLDGVVTSWNPAACRLFGYTADEMIGRHISTLVGPGREDEVPAILEQIRRGEKIDHYETVRRRKDGSLVDVSVSISPIRDDAGTIIGASKLARDITERKRVDAALGASEERFRTLANMVPDFVWIADPEGTITFANDRWFHFCGITPEQNARDWPELVLHPDDRARCLEQWTRALKDGTEYEIEVRNRRQDGEYRWFLTRAMPVRDAEGRISAWFGSTTDIHDRKQSEEHARMLAAELSHRVKNILAIVQTLAERTGDKATSPADFIEAFRGRIQALSSAHKALMATDWHDARLVEIVEAAVAPYLDSPARISLDVPDVALKPEAALTLALAFHELATNAAKHGSFSEEGGRIAITARTEAGELRLDWQEQDGPAVRPPATKGFGTTMLSQAIEYQHHGKAELLWRDEGLLCRLSLPLAQIVPPAPQA